LSTIVCGVLFLLSSLMTSFWASIPDTAIATVLLIVGFLFFDHTATVDWKNTKEALPTFTTCIMTAFSCSVLNGAVIGTLMYVLLTLTTDYADNVTETVLKSVFKAWRVLTSCWHTDADTDTDVDELESRDEFVGLRHEAGGLLPATSSSASETTGLGLPDFTKFGEKYYQSSS
jgi:hypothetical protein